ncbi:MAG: Toluene tolerance, Ttg2 [Syntrophus sp. PtaU1.Bin208]|nr:MAG: Toluene tolerance, Ttg2 [Syntrophus sp. PtaU1.Bin208]
MKRFLASLVFGLFLCVPTLVFAGAAMDTVHVHVDKILAILKDPALKSPSAKERKKEKLRTIYIQMFDEVELSKRALARNWNNLNAAQRDEFVHLFRQVLEKTYADRILAYANEDVIFDRESMISENQAEVKTRIVTSSKTIPFTYRMIRKGNVWRVYDVVVENISLIQNYRTQFNEILAHNSPEQLLQTLRKKVKET